MIHRILALSAALSAPALAQGPGVAWTAEYNSPFDHQDEPRRLALGVGGLFVGGRSYEVGNGDNMTLLRYAADGTLVWARHYDGPAHGGEQVSSVVPDGEGGAYVCGYSSDTRWNVALLHYDKLGELGWVERVPVTGSLSSDFEPRLALAPDGSLRLGYTTNENFAVRAYAPGGELLWSTEVDTGGGRLDLLSSIAVDQAGNTAIAGATDFASGGFESAMLDADGNLLWMDNEFGEFGATLGPAFVAFDATGDVVVSGTTEGFCGVHHIHTWRVSPTGERLWTQIFPPGQPCDLAAAVGMAVDADGNTLVLGQSLQQGVPGSYNVTVLKYDDAGEPLWAHTIELPGVDIPFALDLDPAGNVYIADSTARSGSEYDAVIASLSPAGNERWLVSYDSGATNDRPEDLAVTARGEVYFSEMGYLPPNNDDIVTVKLRPFIIPASPSLRP